jgi:adenine specific DNA methylase Mod
MNTLYYGDNLDILRNHIADEVVDLVYLDPPFNSKRDYNLLFRSPKGQKSEAQITAFEDSWHWGEQAEREFDELLHQPNTDVAQLMKALRAFLGENDMMAYLTMMANRLLELHRVLKPTGSLYLHCDPTASHYLKIVLDGVFGFENYRNEISWRRSHPKGLAFTRFASNHDVIFAFAKDTRQTKWNPVYVEHDPDRVAEQYKLQDTDGRRYQLTSLLNPNPDRPNLTYEFKGVTRVWRWTKERMLEADAKGLIVVPKGGAGIPRFKRYLDEQEGVPVSDFWNDIGIVTGAESLGYPTQKPLALLERIILANSNEGDVVLDPFCGCGTAVHASEKLKRQWIGIDITHLAISLIEKRLKDAFGASCTFEVKGTPEDLASATDLAARDKYQFQWWAVSRVEAQPFQGKKKGADGGIDGLKFFYDLRDTSPRTIVVSVKGGALKADDVRALNHVREREHAEIGILVSLNEPTKGMKADAAAAGFFTAESGKKYPRIQLLTVEGLLSGTQRAEHPEHVKDVNFKKAKKEPRSKSKDRPLFDADESN